MSRHGGNIREASEKYRLPPGRILDFSANINPLGLCGMVKGVIGSNIASLLHYPDPECKALKKKLADFSGLKPSNLLIGNGSIELIYLAPRALSSSRVLIPIPTFSEYESSARQQKCKILFVRTKDDEGFRIKTEEIIKVLPRADLIFICNPNNPTGVLMPKDEVIYLAKTCRRHGATLLMDEVFIDFVKNENDFSVIREAAKLNNLLVLRSLTKFFALPGLRLGYMAGNKDLIAKLSGYQFPWSVNCFAQLVGTEVIEDKNYIRQSKELIIKEREYLFGELKNIKGLRPYPPTANFIFCRLDKGWLDSKRLRDRLGVRGILIRDCGNFRSLNDRYIRIAVRRRGENDRLINALKGIPAKRLS